MNPELTRPAWLRYGAALGAVGLATAARLAIAPVVGTRQPYGMYYFAVLFSAWYGGIGPGALASALGYATALGLFFPLQGGSVEIVGTITYFALSASFIWFTESGRRGKSRLDREADERRRAEASALAQTLRLNAMLASVGDAVIVADDDANVLAMNPVAEALTGWRDDEARGAPIREVFKTVDEATRQTAEMPVAAVVRDGASIRLTENTDLVARDGAVRSIETSTAPFRDDAGAISGAVLIFRDVTGRRQAQRALQESVEQQRRARDEIQRLNRVLRARLAELEVLFETVPIGIAIADDVECRRLRSNPAFARMLQPRSATGDDAEPGPAGDGLTRLLDPSPMKKAAATGESVSGAELEVVLADGRSRTLFGNASPLFDEEGAPRGAIGAFLDLTERRRVDQELQRKEEQLRLSIEATALGLFDWDLKAGRVTLSEPCKAIFGLEPDAEVTFERFFGLVHPDDRARVREIVTAAFDPATGGTYLAQYRCVRGDGTARWVDARGRVTFEEDGASKRAVRFLGTVQDVTADKDAEAQLRQAKESAETANQAKDRFLAVLSHELRTPLTPILMTVSAMATDPDLPGQVRDDLEMIRRNIELETRLIDDLLDLSRVIAGKLPLNLRTASVNDLVRHVLDILAAELHDKGLAVETDLAAEPGLVNGDPARLQQVFWNLLKNAAKFTPAGGRVRVSTRHENGAVEVEVVDSGRGIEPEAISVIFNAFEQGNAATTREYGGLGLGLAIAKAVVDVHGGTIRAASGGPGTGASFTVGLPPLAAADGRGVGHAPAAGGEPGPAENLRVLLVEDHVDTAKILRRLLGRAGYDVRWADSVAAAVRLAADEPFDLLVSDLGLPDGNGYDVMKAVKSLRDVPGIAMSGFGMEADVDRAREAGFREHLTKPVDIATLETAIRRIALRPAPVPTAGV